MDIDHAARDRLYRRAVEALGREEADTLMASLPPEDWTQLTTKDDLRLVKDDLRLVKDGLRVVKDDLRALEERFDLKLEALEHRLTASFESALRRQTQWVFGAVVVLALTSLAGTISALTLA